VAGHQLAGEHAELRVVANDRVTLRLIKLTGLHQLLSVYASREDALAEHPSVLSEGRGPHVRR
jgi:hypothetical protein